MVLMLVPLFAGMAVGRLRGGRLARIGDLRFRAPALVFVGFASQASLGHVAHDVRRGAVVLSYLTVGAWIAINTRARALGLGVAFVLVGLGWAMTFAAIAPHGSMPVSGEALSAIGAPASFNAQEGHLYKHSRRTSRNATTWLGDEIAIPAL